MDKLGWIATVIAVIVAIVGTFVSIPYAASILLIAGLVAGVDVPEDRRSAVLLSTLVLIASSGPLTSLTGGAGDILGQVASNLSVAYMGASLTVIAIGLVARLKP